MAAIFKSSLQNLRPLPTSLNPTSEAGVRFPAQPQVGKLVVACC